MIGLYAVVLQAMPGASGAQGETLREVRCGSLALLVGEAPPPLSAFSLRSHEAVVRRIAEACDPCLPARFGTSARVLSGLDVFRRTAAAGPCPTIR